MTALARIQWNMLSTLLIFVGACAPVAKPAKNGRPPPVAPCGLDHPQACQSSCEHGVPWACTVLGVVQLRHVGAPADAERALGYLSSACEGGDGQACGLLANEHVRGALARFDLQRATRLYERGCGLGYAPACWHFASLALSEDQWTGRSTQFDVFRRASVQACFAGYGDACENASFASYVEGWESSSAYYRQLACRTGVTSACVPLGHAKPSGASPDLVNESKRACLRGETNACGRWGTLQNAGSEGRHACHSSRRNEEQPATGRRCFEFLIGECTQGDGTACSELADFYDEGQWVRRDPAKALALFEIARSALSTACADGAGSACLSLARLIRDGRHHRWDPHWEAHALDAKRRASALGVEEEIKR